MMAKSDGMERIATPAGADVSDEMVGRVGKALRQVAEIKDTYTERMAASRSDSAMGALADQAEAAALKALHDQGLSVDEYEQVVGKAEADPSLEERLLTAARAA